MALAVLLLASCRTKNHEVAHPDAGRRWVHEHGRDLVGQCERVTVLDRRPFVGLEGTSVDVVRLGASVGDAIVLPVGSKPGRGTWR